MSNPPSAINRFDAEHEPNRMVDSHTSFDFEQVSGLTRNWQRWLSRTIDLGLAGTIFVAPLFMGGRHPWGNLVFVGLISASVLAWTIRQITVDRGRWIVSGAEWLVLAGIAILFCQLLPTSPEWLARLSPTIQERLPLWEPSHTSPAEMGIWNRVSLTPEATRGGIVMLLAYAMLFFVVVQRVQHLADAERLLRWVATAAVAMAILGLAQYLVGNGRFLWFYAHPTRDTFETVKGTFANRNHFAHFLALGVGPLIWWMQKALDRRGRSIGSRDRDHLSDRERLATTFLAISLGIVAFAGLLSFSRGGIAALLLAAAVPVVIYAFKSLLGTRSVFALIAITILVGAGVFTHGYEFLQKRLQSVTEARSMEDLSRARFLLWEALADAIPDYVVLGSGVGSHREVYPTYFSHHFDREFTHAESGWLQVLLETGVPGLLVVLIGAGLAIAWCVRAIWRSRSRSLTACAAAVLAGIVVSVLHSVVDFVWYIPACMSLALILAAVACRLNQLAASQTGSQSPSIVMVRLGWTGVTIFLVLTSAFMLKSLWGPALAASHWERYFELSLAHDQSAELPPTDETESQAVSSESIALMRGHLSRVLQHHPDNARAHVRMAAICLRLFEMEQKDAANAMSLAVIRDAALAARFPSKEAQNEWLDVAIGENRKLLDQALKHVHRGLQLCPLQGQGYVYLAELSFLEGTSSRAKGAYIEQALKVRPHHGSVLLAAGREAVLANDLTKALHFWREAFQLGSEYQTTIVRLLGRMPASFFLENFNPDAIGLRMLFDHYERSGPRDQAETIGRIYVRKVEQQASLETGTRAARFWIDAHRIYRFLGDTARATKCVKAAVEAAPRDYHVRRLLAIRLCEQKCFAEAVEPLKWCLHRNPRDKALRKYLSRARREASGADESTAERVAPLRMSTRQ